VVCRLSVVVIVAACCRLTKPLPIRVEQNLNLCVVCVVLVSALS
jgi:hypothetical protein